MSKEKVVSNLIWRYLERFGAQIVTFVVSIVLARILDPAVYGTIALVTVIITILQVFVDSGLGNALIQKKNADEIDFSTVFYFNIAFCLVIYVVLFFCAPLISWFYELPELTSIVRVLGLSIVISGVKNVQQAYVSKHMLFQKFFFSTLGGTIGSAIVGIAFAVLGFGVWALVAQNLFNLSVTTCILWITVKWRPTRQFSFQRLKGLFSFGWKLLVSSLLETVYNNVRSLIIGKKYTTEDLSFYNRGKQFPQIIVDNVNTSIDSVLLPVLSEEQENKQRVRAMTRRAIKTSSYIMWPCMVGLGICAEPLVRLLLTEKWLPCVPFLQIFCFTYAFYPIHTANLNAMKALGRSDLFLILEIIKKVIGVVAIVISMWFGVLAMAYSLLITTVLNSIINAWPNKKLLGYSYFEQIKDMLPAMLLAGTMGAVVYCINFLNLNSLLTLIIQVPLGIAIYIAGSLLFKFESFQYILNMVKDLFHKRAKKVEIKNETQKFFAGEGTKSYSVDMIRAFLSEADRTFITPISQKKNLEEYAEKLFEKATICAKCENDRILSMLAGYTDHVEGNKAYIALVATLPEAQGKGYATALLGEFIEICKKKKLDAVHLYSENNAAIRMYRNIGFVDWKKDDETRTETHLIYRIENFDKSDQNHEED